MISLCLLLHLPAHVCSNYATLDLSTADEWMAVLKLATRLQFPSIRELAISRLRPLLLDAPLERLVMARACGVEAWVGDALDSLVKREERLVEGEAARMTIGDVVHVTSRREAEAEVRVVSALRMDPFIASAFEAKDDAERVEHAEQQREEDEEKTRREREVEHVREVAVAKARAEAEAAAKRNAKADAAAAAARMAAKRKAKEHESTVWEERAAERKRGKKGGSKGADDI